MKRRTFMGALAAALGMGGVPKKNKAVDGRYFETAVQTAAVTFDPRDVTILDWESSDHAAASMNSGQTFLRGDGKWVALGND